MSSRLPPPDTQSRTAATSSVVKADSHSRLFLGPWALEITRMSPFRRPSGVNFATRFHAIAVVSDELRERPVAADAVWKLRWDSSITTRGPDFG